MGTPFVLCLLLTSFAHSKNMESEGYRTGEHDSLSVWLDTTPTLEYTKGIKGLHGKQCSCGTESIRFTLYCASGYKKGIEDFHNR